MMVVMMVFRAERWSRRAPVWEGGAFGEKSHGVLPPRTCEDLITNATLGGFLIYYSYSMIYPKQGPDRQPYSNY